MLIYLAIINNGHNQSEKFEGIYKKYKNTVYAIIFKYLKDKESTADIMQEVFIRLFKTMGRLQTEDDIRRWLIRLTKNAAIDAVGKETRYNNKIAVYLDNDEMAVDIIDRTAENPMDEALKQEFAEYVSNILATLKPIHADAIRLKYYFGFTVEEIAKLTNAPVHTVYSRLDKAKNLVYSELISRKQEYEPIAEGVFKDAK